jgi:hypothetical protein
LILDPWLFAGPNVVAVQFNRPRASARVRSQGGFRNGKPSGCDPDTVAVFTFPGLFASQVGTSVCSLINDALYGQK